MKTIFLASLIITITLITIVIYDKVVVQQFDFGPASILAISVLAAWFLFSSISLVLYQMGKREAIANIWLSIASSFLIYLIGDLIAGYALIVRLSPRMVPDLYVHHKLKPNTHSEFKGPEYNYIQRVNTLGLRGPDIQPSKQPDTYRILMLGDSFTMGKGVGDHETFSVFLEEYLNGKSTIKNDMTIEVLNAGVDSYAPILSFLQLKKIAIPLEPNLVVLNLDMSDLIQEVAYRNTATYGSDAHIVGIAGREVGPVGKKFLVPVLRNWIDKNLYMTRLVLFYVDKWTTRSNDLTIRNTVLLANLELLKHTLSDDTADRTEQWQNIFDSILNIKKYCSTHGMNFLLTIYPWGHQVNEREWVPGRREYIPENAVISDKSIHTLQDFVVRNNIDLLNTFPGFRAYSGPPPLYFDYDMHWTDAGHKLMARELGLFIETTYFNDPNQGLYGD